MMSNYESMSGPELVRAFNELVNSNTGKELGIKPVQRFADTAIGRKRCEMLASAIRARESGLAAADRMPSAKVKQPLASPSEDVFVKFKTNTKKFRGKLLAVMSSNLGTQLDVRALIDAVYGKKANAAHIGALKMVLRGLELSIDKGKLPYRINKQKNETGEVTYGLYSTEQA